ncbi:methyl-accepting chemotaxis protein, partial [Xanthomonas perforans]|nr:methyl-accepting chemotaxis protein [Xanthomonas perforans]
KKIPSLFIEPSAPGRSMYTREPTGTRAVAVFRLTSDAGTPPVRGATNALAATKPAAAKHAVHEHRRRA